MLRTSFYNRRFTLRAPVKTVSLETSRRTPWETRRHWLRDPPRHLGVAALVSRKMLDHLAVIQPPTVARSDGARTGFRSTGKPTYVGVSPGVAAAFSATGNPADSNPLTPLVVRGARQSKLPFSPHQNPLPPLRVNACCFRESGAPSTGEVLQPAPLRAPSGRALPPSANGCSGRACS